MQKKNVLNLIKYHAENNNIAFQDEAYEIAKYFDKTGDSQLAEYIVALLSNANIFVPQINIDTSSFFQKITGRNNPIPLPVQIESDIIGVINAVHHNAGVNKFLFEGTPGTGKTETAKQLSLVLERELFSVQFEGIIDSKLGQTAKNIAKVFEEINHLPHPEKIVILFDEIDALALDRMNSNDLREMGRATSALLKGLDSLNEQVVLIATTNLFNSFDKAIIRRFDSVINFNRYSREELINVAENILNEMITKFSFVGKNIQLFKKIISKMETIPYPGELRNIIKTSIAFSNPNDKYDYLKKLYKTVCSNNKEIELKDLQEAGFTVREIEILTSVSKSQVARKLKE